MPSPNTICVSGAATSAETHHISRRDTYIFPLFGTEISEMATELETDPIQAERRDRFACETMQRRTSCASVAAKELR